MQIDFEHRAIELKVVYYGPALSGKTTNLIELHRNCIPTNRGRLMTLETRDDRTLFFDLLPLHFDNPNGLLITIKVFTVPGQVYHNATRKLVLRGADAVAFIADSQISAYKENLDSFQNLKENFKANGLTLATMPLVIQFNKRDLPDIRSDAELDAMAQRGREPVIKAVAINGVGVAETFLRLMEITWEKLETTHDLCNKFGIDQFALHTCLQEYLAQAVNEDTKEPV